jgi:flavodoxin
MQMTGCGGSDSAESADQAAVQEDLQDETSEGKVLVAYFTRIGNTDSGFPEGVDATTSASLQQTDDGIKGNAQMIAEWIADETGGDLFAIESEELYPADYNETVEKASKDQNAKTRPALTKHVDNMDQYEKVVLVFPNWWSDLPMPVYSFFDEYDLAGNDIVVYVTHEGSRFSNTVGTIQSMEPDARIQEGLAVQGGSVSDEEQNIMQWVKDHQN